jgi:hypothetical protein
MVCLTVHISDREYSVYNGMQHWVSLHTLADLMFIDHAFDEYVSSKISLNRSLPDRRNRHQFFKHKNTGINNII